jgi:heme/copper-type cytochrome/quinol oxidase subunit 2
MRLKRWIGIAVLAVVVGFVLLAPLPVAYAAPQERNFAVTARSFAFSPGTIRVNRGDTVIVRLESTDVVHGLYVDGYGLKSDEAEPGRPVEIRFTADRPGAFRMRCSVACGNMHPFMIGKLVVEPNLTWARAIAATLVTALGSLALFLPRR